RLPRPCGWGHTPQRRGGEGHLGLPRPILLRLELVPAALRLRLLEGALAEGAAAAPGDPAGGRGGLPAPAPGLRAGASTVPAAAGGAPGRRPPPPAPPPRATRPARPGPRPAARGPCGVPRPAARGAAAGAPRRGARVGPPDAAPAAAGGAVPAGAASWARRRG